MHVRSSPPASKEHAEERKACFHEVPEHVVRLQGHIGVGHSKTQRNAPAVDAPPDVMATQHAAALSRKSCTTQASTNSSHDSLRVELAELAKAQLEWMRYARLQLRMPKRNMNRKQCAAQRRACY